MRRGQHKVYVIVLVLLFSSVVTHFGANWTVLRDIFISNNDTRDTMAQVSLTERTTVNLVANIATFLAMWLGDLLLVCI